MCEQVARESQGIQPLGCTCECVSNDGGATVWVPTVSRNSACARRDQINTMQSKERARCGRQRHLQSDWLGSMAGSQATVGLRGGAVRDSSPR
jgi:hypothetical protein